MLPTRRRAFSLSKARKRRFEECLLILGIIPLLFVLALCPRAFAQRTGRVLGRLAFCFSRRDRKRAMENLQGVLHLDFDKALAYAREIFASLGENVAESAWHSFRWPKYAGDVDIRGQEVLFAPLAAGRGVICLSGHIGNWELMAMRLALLEVPGVVVARPLRYPRLQKYLHAFRSRHGLDIVYRGASAKEAIANHLRKGALVGMLVDQDFATKGVVVPFFSRPAHTPVGPLEIAAETGAILVTGFITRTSKRKHLIQLEFLADGAQLDLEATSIKATLSELNRRIERAILKNPGAWPWFHKRWRCKA